MKYETSFEKNHCDFENSRETLQLVKNLKPTRIFSAIMTIIAKNIPTYPSELYSILLSKRLKDPKVGPHPPSTTQIKKMSSGLS